MKSKFLSLGTRDLIKGGVLSAIVAVLTAVYEAISANGFDNINWKTVITTAVLTIISYFIKNLSTNSEDKLLTKEPK